MVSYKRNRWFWWLIFFLLSWFQGCSHTTELPISAGMGPDPVLPPPAQNLIPTLNVAPAVGWPPGVKPMVDEDLSVRAFAEGFDHPRWIYVLPNGDVLVAESNAPAEKGKTGIKSWIMKHMKKKAGAAVSSADRITLLRDVDGDGVVDLRTVFLDGLHSPFGMLLVGNEFYVANTDALLRFAYTDNATHIKTPGTHVATLPNGPINRHWTRNVIAGPKGKLYVTVGSDSDHGENGIKNEVDRAAIWEVNPETGAHRIFASGLRNPNGMFLEPGSGVLWTAVNERDELGNNLVPDFMTSIQEGGFYGWPYCYYGQHLDPRVQHQNPELVAKAIVPDYALGSHTASLGLIYNEQGTLPNRFQNGAFVGQHGSWNRKPHSGYKVIFIPFAGGRPSGKPLDVLTGFLSPDGRAYGRPVGVAVDRQGALLVADDVGNIVWRVTAAAK
jgi:glucose/arabinose dehydrogenase